MEKERMRQRAGGKEGHRFVVPLMYAFTGGFLCVS